MKEHTLLFSLEVRGPGGFRGWRSLMTIHEAELPVIVRGFTHFHHRVRRLVASHDRANWMLL